MRRNIFNFMIVVTALGFLSSCGNIPVLSGKGVQKAAFNVSDADLAAADEKTKGQQIVTKELVRVGLLLPLTGKSAKLGEVLRNSAMMSLFDVSNPHLVLQFYDTQGTQEGARTAAETAIAQGVELLIGPVFSAEVRAVRPSTHDANIGVITFSSDPANLGDGIYTISTLTSQQVEHITRFACDKGYKRFALLSQDNATGDIISMAMKSAVDSCGGKITKAAFYDPKTEDYQASFQTIMPRLMEDLEKEREDELKRLESAKELVERGKPVLMKNEETGEMQETAMTMERLQATIDALKETELVRDPFEFDAVLIAEEGSRLRSLGALLSYYDVPPEIKILGTSQWADSKPAREQALVGGWFSHLPSEGFAAFSDRYKQIYGDKPPRIASQAYDAVALAAILTETGSFSTGNLTTVSGFKGVDGLFRLLPNGLSERGLQVLGVEKKGFVTLSPALEVFDMMPVYAPDVYIKDFRNSPDLVSLPVTEKSAVLQEPQTTDSLPVVKSSQQKTATKSVQNH